MKKCMCMKICTIVFLFTSLVCLPLQAVCETLTLSTIEGVKNVDISKKVVIEAYGRIGIKISIIKYPGLRALKLSNKGITDGELHRMLEPPVQSYPLYHFLHKKNRDLVPRITLVLQKMEKEGEIKKFELPFLSEIV